MTFGALVPVELALISSSRLTFPDTSHEFRRVSNQSLARGAETEERQTATKSPLLSPRNDWSYDGKRRIDGIVIVCVRTRHPLPLSDQ
jgi:hypothetical protein